MKRRCPYCGKLLTRDTKYVYEILDTYNHKRHYCSIRCAEKGREREVEVMIKRLVYIKNQKIKKEHFDE